MQIEPRANCMAPHGLHLAMFDIRSEQPDALGREDKTIDIPANAVFGIP